MAARVARGHAARLAAAGGAHRYEEGVRGNARSGASVKQARDAERALDGPEADALREAEQEGKEAARRERH